jgi:hypothetical protein
MNPNRLLSPRTFLALSAIAMTLAPAIGAVLAVGAIVGAMGDAAGQSVFHWIAVGLAIPLAVDLLGLLLALGLRASIDPEPAADPNRLGNPEASFLDPEEAP